MSSRDNKYLRTVTLSAALDRARAHADKVQRPVYVYKGITKRRAIRFFWSVAPQVLMEIVATDYRQIERVATVFVPSPPKTLPNRATLPQEPRTDLVAAFVKALNAYTLAHYYNPGLADPEARALAEAIRLLVASP